MSRVPAGATAFGSRDAGFLMNYIGLWLDPAEDEANIALGASGLGRDGALRDRGAVRQLPRRRGRGGRRARPTRRRRSRGLQSLKAQYDPTNFFHLNQNIKPATRAATSR